MHNWELESLTLFMDLVYSTNVRGIGSNKVCWKPAMSRGFEVRGYYLSLPYYYHIFSLRNGVAIEGTS